MLQLIKHESVKETFKDNFLIVMKLKTITIPFFIFFRDFLRRVTEYGFNGELMSSSGFTSSSNTSDPLASLTHQVMQRHQKLEKYRQKKELEDEINKLKIIIKEERVDEETEREFYIKLLNLSIIDAHEELSSISQEKQLLEFQMSRKEMVPKGNVISKSLKPVIITRDLAQKAVYGIGYPSLPTMTVGEFYDDRVRNNIFPDPKSTQTSTTAVPTQEHTDEIEKEEKLEQDDEYERARLRARDEYKDNHRRGEGNRYNRS